MRCRGVAARKRITVCVLNDNQFPHLGRALSQTPVSHPLQGLCYLLMVIMFIYGAFGEQSVLLLGKCLCICHLLFFFKLPTYEATPPGFYWTPPRNVGWLHLSITDSQTSLSSILLLAYSLQLFTNQKQLINEFYKVLYFSEGVSAVGVIIIIIFINMSQASLVNLFLVTNQ